MYADALILFVHLTDTSKSYIYFWEKNLGYTNNQYEFYVSSYVFVYICTFRISIKTIHLYKTLDRMIAVSIIIKIHNNFIEAYAKGISTLNQIVNRQYFFSW